MAHKGVWGHPIIPNIKYFLTKRAQIGVWGAKKIRMENFF